MERLATETEVSTIVFGDDGILRAVYKPGVVVTAPAARDETAVMAELTGGRGAPVLVDIRGARSVTGEARTFYSSGEAKRVFKAVAFLVESAVSRVIGSFFISLNRPPYPCRLFTNEPDAVEWLKGLAE